MAAGVKAPPPTSCFGKLPLADFAYRCMIAYHQTPAAAVKSTEESIKKAREDLVAAQERPLNPSTDGCVVVFNYSQHALNAYRDLSQSSWQRMTGSCRTPKGPLLADVGHKQGNIQDYPEARDAGASGGQVVAQHAPEPSDYW